MERLKTICERCNRSIRKVEHLLDDEGHAVCLRCHKALTRNIPVATFIKADYAPYAWLKLPAILLGSIGVLGILMDTIEAVAIKFSVLNMPPRGSCYLTAAGAMILLAIATLYKQSKGKITVDKKVPLQDEENWRTV